MISDALSNLFRGQIYSRLFFAQQECVLCGADSGQDLLCTACHSELPRAPAPACPACAAPLELAGEGEVCGACLKHPPAQDRTVAALRYEFPADQLIQALKYRDQLALARLFSQLLRAAVAHAPCPDVLIPMPLHPERARERGFNQALEIARPLANILDLRLDTTSLARTRNTTAQAALPLDRRQGNVKGAFACKETIAGQHVAVLDDVMTSGATLNEAAAALKKAGAREVSLWVVARAVTHH